MAFGLIPLLALVMGSDPGGTILLIGHDPDHPPTTHEYLADCRLLAKCLEQTPGVKTIVRNGWPSERKEWEGIRAIVLHLPKGGNLLFASPARRQAERVLATGVGLSAIHYATGADPGEQAELYLTTLGGWYHNSFCRYLVRFSELEPAGAGHPIERGVQKVRILEEFYLDLKFQPATTPVFAAVVEGKRHTIGWAYTRPGGGRSFGFVGGHFHGNFGLKPFRQAIVNGILWTARQDIPADGAPCSITDEDMKLPGAKRQEPAPKKAR